MLRFLSDENISRDFGAIANEEKCDYLFVAHVFAGAADHDILAHTSRERRILVTEDLDFGRLVFGLGAQASGVVLIRIAPWKRQVRSERFRWLVRNQAVRLAILGEISLRIRPLN